MINEIECQQNVKTEYFDQNQAENERARNHMDTNGKEAKLPILRKLLEVQVNNNASTHTVLTLGLSMSVLSFDTEGASVRISPIGG